MHDSQFPNPYEAIFQGIQKQKILLEEILGEVKSKHTFQSPNYKGSKEAATFLNKTENAVRVMVCKKQLKSIKKGNRLFFLESDLIEYLESGRRMIPSELVDSCEDSVAIKTKSTSK